MRNIIRKALLATSLASLLAGAVLTIVSKNFVEDAKYVKYLGAFGGLVGIASVVRGSRDGQRYQEQRIINNYQI